MTYKVFESHKVNMKIRAIIKKLANPRVRRRLKIGLAVYGLLIIIGVLFKVVYDIGYFNAQAVKNDRIAGQAVVNQVLTMEAAQQIVTGALKEDPTNRKTIVAQIIDNNQKLSTIVIENKNIKRIAWIIDMRLFFVGDLFSYEGYNLTEGLERQYNINHGDY